MPRAHLTGPLEGEPNTRALTDELMREWLGKGLAGGPIIIEQETPGQHRRLYVIWDEWAPIGVDVRSSIIMDAYRQLAPVGNVLRVTLAWGLTSAEAANLGIQYELEG